MRTRAMALIAGLTIVAFLAALLGSQPQASARLQTGGTPEATPVENGTPVAGETPTEAPADSGIVTIVMWYQQNEAGTILQLYPVTSEDGVTFARGKAESDAQGGRVVFEEARNEGYPRIRVGDGDYFDAYPIYPGDPASVQRWYYFDDDPSLRPATMVMQIVGIRGTYEDWNGTATFISRGINQGGLLVIAVRPPES
jgi:hypothetical protein